MSFIRCVEREERVERGLGAVETPGGLLLGEELGGAGRPRLGQAVGAR